CGIEGAVKIDVHNFFDNIQFDISEQRPHGNSGIVDEDIDLSVLLNGKLRHLPVAFLHGYVSLKAMNLNSLFPQFGHRLLKGAVVAARYENPASSFSKLLR